MALLNQVNDLLHLLTSKRQQNSTTTTFSTYSTQNNVNELSEKNELNIPPFEISKEYIDDINRGNEEMKAVISKTILLNEGPADKARERIRAYYHQTADTEESLYSCIKEESGWCRGDPLRHPVIWYLAHTACFFINKLRTAGIIKEPVNHHFESTFAVGVDEMSWDDKLQDRDDWPQVKDIWLYRKQVREIVDDLIVNLRLDIPITWSSNFWIILMGIEHARIHLETSSVLIRQVSLDKLKPNGIWNNICRVGKFNKNNNYLPNLGEKGHAPLNELINIKGNIVSYGRKIDNDDILPVYGWDNEYGEMIVDVPNFAVSKYLVSNEEYYDFILNKGYEIEEYWTMEGWKWVISTKSKYPKFWIKNHETNEWKLRLNMIEIDMAWDWPVICNNLEAQAFCKYKSKLLNKNIRLPTEDEWYLLRTTLNNNLDQIDQPYWNQAPGNINLEYYTSECPIDMFGTNIINHDDENENEEEKESNHNNNFSTIYDIIGNVWQHTLTPQHPFKGFIIHPYYDDFTIPCFGPHHNMIKGGSFISTGNESIKMCRYQFRRHFFQHAGIRYIESNRNLQYIEMLKDNSCYNNDNMINLYTHFHYWDEKYFNVPNFAQQVAQICLKYSNSNMRNKALDIGCAVGRTSYELAHEFKQVIGLDFTSRLIGVGYRLQELGFLEWDVILQGEIKQHYKITAKQLGIDKILNKVYFAQNDAQNLDEKYHSFDLIVASNLIDRLNNPLLFLSNIHSRLNLNGTLILLSPYTWLEEFTPKNLWIGGKDNLFTQNELHFILSKHFQFIIDFDVPFVIRETQRKFQHSISHCTIWMKISD